MAIKDILVVVDEAGDPATTVRAAMKLAEDHGAHLTGLYVSVEPTWPLYAYGPVPTDALNALRAQADKAAEAARATFTKIVNETSLSVDFRTQEATAALADEIIALHARHADLVVLGQSTPDNERPAGNDMPEEVIFYSGRPVLVVPYVGINHDTFGRRVMVGWDGSREAARALNDALPLIDNAEKAFVITVNPKPGNSRHGELPGADIALHLARHGINVEVMHETVADIDPDQVILSRASDLDIDMLVLGAYGTPRLQERVFGGVTRTILQEMTVPVLFSH